MKNKLILCLIFLFVLAAAPAALAEPVVPQGYEIDELSFGLLVNDIELDPEGGLVATVSSTSRLPCDSYIASLSMEGVIDTFAEICVDHPISLDFDTSGRLFFEEGAGFWDDTYWTVRGGTQEDTTLFANSHTVLTRDLIFGPNSYLYVSDVYTGNIRRFDANGVVEPVASGFSTLSTGSPSWFDLAFDSNGTLFVADEGTQSIYTVSNTGTVTPFVTGIGQVSGISFAPDGTLFASVWNTGEILAIAPDASVSVWATGFTQPCRVLVDDEGSVFLIEMPSWGAAADFDRRILRVSQTLIQISIDIKPGSDRNSINLCSNGGVPIAILGSETISVADINTDTLRFAEASVKVVGKKDPHTLCSVEYVNNDMIEDLVCHFLTTDIAALDKESTTASLNGELVDGTPILGTDTVSIVKDTCK